MLQASVLSSADRLEIPNYKYHGGDLSLMYKYALSPFAQFCVDKVLCNFIGIERLNQTIFAVHTSEYSSECTYLYWTACFYFFTRCYIGGQSESW